MNRSAGIGNGGQSQRPGRVGRACAKLTRRSRFRGNPEGLYGRGLWIPAFAGMTGCCQKLMTATLHKPWRVGDIRHGDVDTRSSGDWRFTARSVLGIYPAPNSPVLTSMMTILPLSWGFSRGFIFSLVNGLPDGGGVCFVELHGVTYRRQIAASPSRQTAAWTFALCGCPFRRC